MQVTLMGPDDLGLWVLADDDGNTYPLVEHQEDHTAAAFLLGWEAPEGVTDEEALTDSAIDFLTENSGEDFEAPKRVVEFFEKLGAEDEE